MPMSVPPPQSPRDVAERRQPRHPAVRRDPRRVHPGPTDKGDAPATIRSDADGRIGVVQDLADRGEATPVELGGKTSGIADGIGAGEPIDRDVGSPSGGEPGLRPRLRHEAHENVQPGVHPHLLMRCRRTAHRGEQPAVVSDDRDVGLRVAAVDGEDRHGRSSQPTIVPP
jgi:hypothetical protein